MKTVPVVVADDHSLFREGLAKLLASEQGIRVIARAQTGTEVLEIASEHPHALVLMDITMPEMDGLEATRRLAERHPGVRVLIVSAYTNKENLFAAIRAGAQGYVLKDSEPAVLIRAIREVAGGRPVIDPSLIPQLLEGVREMGYDPVDMERRKLHLSGRELEVLTLLATTSAPVEIASDLGISPKTLQNHISSIYRKLEVGCRAEAIIKAAKLGLTEPRPE